MLKKVKWKYRQLRIRLFIRILLKLVDVYQKLAVNSSNADKMLKYAKTSQKLIEMSIRCQQLELATQVVLRRL